MTTHLIPRFRRLAVALLAAAGLVTVAAGPAAATTPPTAGKPVYLALGDSVPFGYHNSPFDPQTQTAQWQAYYRNPHRFRSYADDVAADRHLRLVNASCPGETSGSFISTSNPSYACENLYRLLAPLHVQYSGSQLDFATHFLATTRNVRLVTVQLGANDGFLCQAQGGCTTLPQIQAEAAQVAANLHVILTSLRATGYRGPIDVVDYYALNYADQASTAATAVLDRAIDAAAVASHDTVVSGFAAFLPIAWLKGGGDSRAAGLVRPAPDVHPTPFGHRVLATAVELADPRH